MDTIFIEGLIFSGAHGVHAYEKRRPQRFGVDLSVTLHERDYRDDIKNTFDYRTARELIRSILEGGHVKLIETLAEKIADGVLLLDSRLYSVRVTLRKLDIFERGVPGVIITRFQPDVKRRGFLDFNLEQVIEALKTVGAVSLPILTETKRKALLSEALKCTYEHQPTMLKSGVKEELSSVREFSEASAFYGLKKDFEEVLFGKLALLNTYPFVKPLSFNELSLQKYKKGSLGITPHKDGKSCINLVCVFILEGKGTFALCSNRKGTNPQYIDTKVGNVILMRAPGFLGSDYQPMHLLRDIEKDRYVFGLRQKI